METRRIFVTIASLLASASSQAEIVMNLGANRVHYQISGQSLRFDNGELNLHLRDGNAVLDGSCVVDPQPIFFPPSDIPSCPLGATGLVVSGDVDGDGVRDDNLYYSMTDTIPAFVVEPSRQDLCQLYAGPPSKLPRPLSNFKDETEVIFYNISTPIVQQFDITEYDLDRPYGPGAGELKRMKEELIPGQYVFTFPRIDFPELTPVAIPVTIVPNLEAVDPASRTRAGFKFTSGTWDGDIYQMDPRLINKITWTGNDRTVVRPGDQIYFSIMNPDETELTFPPTEPEAPVFLSTPTVQQYNMPPFFYVVGDDGVMNLEYARFLRTNGVAADSSTRDFRAKVRFVDSYPGYVQTTLPLGSAKRDLDPTGDIDHDGVTNVEEYAYQFPTNEDLNASAKALFVPDVNAVRVGKVPFPATAALLPAVSEKYYKLVSTVDEPITDPALQPAGTNGPFLDEENHIVFEVPLRPRVGNTLKYTFQELVSVNSKGKKKFKNLKINNKWTVTTRAVDTTVDLTVRVQQLNILATLQYYDFPLLAVPQHQEFVVLRSIDPVDDPIAFDENPPEIAVKITPVTLK